MRLLPSILLMPGLESNLTDNPVVGYIDNTGSDASDYFNSLDGNSDVGQQLFHCYSPP